jgi:hypothetical protein
MTLTLLAPAARPDDIELQNTASATLSPVRLPVGARFPRRPMGKSGTAVTGWSAPGLALVPVYAVGARFPRRSVEETQLRELVSVMPTASGVRRPVGARFPRH